MEGLIYKSTGSWYNIHSADGQQYRGRMKGKFKIDDITSTNPLAVGDEVTFDELELEDGLVMITSIKDRRNYIARQSPHNKHQHHIVAANLDQCLLFATLREPRTSRGFIDRFLVTAEAYHIPAVIVFNKTDVYRKKELSLLEEITKDYGQVGYGVLATSLVTKEGLDMLAAHLKNKTTLLSGHSGVGKSTFLNLLVEGGDIKTQDVSKRSGKGMHTTTFAEMYHLPGGGKVIDTPGLREFALVDISREELSHYFPEMRKLVNECKFNNCLHLNDPGCAVVPAVQEGIIPAERYASYVTLLDSMGQNGW